jgi:hypothetical protein
MKARLLALAALTALVLTACGESVSDEYERESEPYSVEEVAEGEIPRVTLVPSAVQRLGIETVPVGSVGQTLVVPAEAVYLNADGTFWVYTNPETNVYVREVVELIRETSEFAFLSAGPAPGTEVVTVGVPELYGAETGFGT